MTVSGRFGTLVFVGALSVDQPQFAISVNWPTPILLPDILLAQAVIIFGPTCSVMSLHDPYVQGTPRMCPRRPDCAGPHSSSLMLIPNPAATSEKAVTGKTSKAR